MSKNENDSFSAEEIARRRDAAIHRALNTPPSSNKELIGKTERAKQRLETKALRFGRTKPKGGEGA